MCACVCEMRQKGAGGSTLRHTPWWIATLSWSGSLGVLLNSRAMPDRSQGRGQMKSDDPQALQGGVGGGRKRGW